jgi:hypothetical protein
MKVTHTKWHRYDRTDIKWGRKRRLAKTKPVKFKIRQKEDSDKLLMPCKLFKESNNHHNERRIKFLTRQLNIQKDMHIGFGIKFLTDAPGRVVKALQAIETYRIEWQTTYLKRGYEEQSEGYKKKLLATIKEMKISNRPIPTYHIKKALPGGLSIALKCFNLVAKLGGPAYEWLGQARFIKKYRILLRIVTDKQLSTPAQYLLSDFETPIMDIKYEKELNAHWGKPH